ncbi:receptor-like cytosolic serine/threonine-protein kinase RBK2 isoform X2 [Gossypium hirsutum]|uniref:Receptor-like cytosolic serine/threonine-protein kinase RBK2 isoform X2 n=1 Tax=Gossypium hirsutum TaxID=3635 RepID=A0A1U8I219_GOSHI|nr:receptor-like cytosolic serine/threonine-protein kinase RBK2 isoform X2 [Gossypium hirsutum]
MGDSTEPSPSPSPSLSPAPSSVEPSTDNKNSNKKGNEKKIWEPFRLIMKKHRFGFADFISSLDLAQLKIEAERIDRPSPISAPKDCTTNAVESKQPATKPSMETADSKPPETTETAGSKPPETTETAGSKPPETTETADSKQPATKPSSETPESKKPATKPSTETPESKPPATKPSKETSESKQSATKPSTDTAEPESNSAKTSTSTESKLYNNFTSITQWRGFFPALKKGVVIPTHSLTPLIPKFTRRKSKRIREDTIPQSSPALDTEAFNFKSSWKNFSLSELQEATDNYSREHLIGQGGYAEVYKGKLKSGKFVAIKKLTRGSPEEMTMDFLSELGIIVHVDHPNIAKMIGYGVEGGMHLVLQLSPHGSLASILYGPKEKLDWRTRFKIAVGTAKGLSYLHEGCQRRIIHKDIKAANILLTEDFDAQISDFGLAKWLPDQWTHHTVSKVEGTFGYLPPEFFMYGIVNEKTDVFAYGVLLLELITGRQAIGSSQQSLIMWVVSILNGDRNSLEGLKEGEHSVLKRTYSEEMDDAEEYNSTKYLSDINRQLEILLDCSKDTL